MKREDVMEPDPMQPVYHYHCINLSCKREGLTRQPPTFTKEIFGHFCPECARAGKPGRLALYCTVCRGVVGALQLKDELPDETAARMEPIAFTDGCHRCGNEKLSDVRITLAKGEKNI